MADARMKLKVGDVFSTNHRLPIMPEIDPADPLVAIAKIRHSKKNALLRVVAVQSPRDREAEKIPFRVRRFWHTLRKTGSLPGPREVLPPWYQVGSGQADVIGWINSTALVGKKILVRKPKK